MGPSYPSGFVGGRIALYGFAGPDGGGIPGSPQNALNNFPKVACRPLASSTPMAYPPAAFEACQVALPLSSTPLTPWGRLLRGAVGHTTRSFWDQDAQGTPRIPLTDLGAASPRKALLAGRLNLVIRLGSSQQWQNGSGIKSTIVSGPPRQTASVSFHHHT